MPVRRGENDASHSLVEHVGQRVTFTGGARRVYDDVEVLQQAVAGIGGREREFGQLAVFSQQSGDVALISHQDDLSGCWAGAGDGLFAGGPEQGIFNGLQDIAGVGVSAPIVERNRGKDRDADDETEARRPIGDEGLGDFCPASEDDCVRCFLDAAEKVGATGCENVADTGSEWMGDDGRDVHRVGAIAAPGIDAQKWRYRRQGGPVLSGS